MDPGRWQRKRGEEESHEEWNPVLVSSWKDAAANFFLWIYFRFDLQCSCAQEGQSNLLVVLKMMEKTRGQSQVIASHNMWNTRFLKEKKPRSAPLYY